jgi:hypothetical protein
MVIKPLLHRRPDSAPKFRVNMDGDQGVPGIIIEKPKSRFPGLDWI